MSETLKGVVKWFSDSKGFGFIEHPSGKDVFVHYSVIQSDGFKTLKEGEQVEYEVQEGPKGFHAVKVNKPEGSSLKPTRDKQLSDSNMSSEGETSGAEEEDTEDKESSESEFDSSSDSQIN